MPRILSQLRQGRQGRDGSRDEAKHSAAPTKTAMVFICAFVKSECKLQSPSKNGLQGFLFYAFGTPKIDIKQEALNVTGDFFFRIQILKKCSA